MNIVTCTSTSDLSFQAKIHDGKFVYYGLFGGNGGWEDCGTSTNDPMIFSSGKPSLLPCCDPKAICVEPFYRKISRSGNSQGNHKKETSYERLDTLLPNHQPRKCHRCLAGCHISHFKLEAEALNFS